MMLLYPLLNVLQAVFLLAWSVVWITLAGLMMLDIPCAFAALPVNLRFVAKHVLRYVPFLGQYMTMTGMVFAA